MGNAKMLIEKYEKRNSLFNMIRGSLTEIISEFNAEMKSKGYSMEEASTELKNGNYPVGTFGLKINMEIFVITIDEVIANLHQGYEKGMVKSIICDIIMDKIKCK